MSTPQVFSHYILNNHLFTKKITTYAINPLFIYHLLYHLSYSLPKSIIFITYQLSLLLFRFISDTEETCHQSMASRWPQNLVLRLLLRVSLAKLYDFDVQWRSCTCFMWIHFSFIIVLSAGKWLLRWKIPVILLRSNMTLKMLQKKLLHEVLKF